MNRGIIGQVAEYLLVKESRLHVFPVVARNIRLAAHMPHYATSEKREANHEQILS
jgi:hypothetical protein